MCNFITDGCMYSFGMFLGEIGTDLSVSATQIAIASSIMCGFYYMLGPITCALMNRFGFRLIGIMGGMMACVAFIIASFAYSLALFLVILGVLGGIGFNMIFTPSFVVVGFYFERWRALATSIAVCGSSMGMVIFPIVATNLPIALTWRFKFLMLGGLMICCSCLAMIFKPLEPTRVYVEGEKKVQFLAERDSIGSFHIETSGHRINTLNKKFNLILLSSKHEDNRSMISSLEKKTSIDHSYLLGQTGASVSSVATKSILKSVTSDRLFTVIEEEEQDPTTNYRCFRFKIRMRNIWNRMTCNVCNPFSNPASRPMYRDDIFYTGSLYTIPEYSKMVLPGPSTKKSAIDYHLSVTKVAAEKPREIKKNHCLPVSIKSALGNMLDYSLFKQPAFIYLLLSGTTSLLGNYTPFVFSELRAIEKGVDGSRTFYILTAMGITNTLGRITCGIISSFPRFDALTITYCTTICCGLITMISNYFYTFELQLLYGGIFGFSMASLAALKSVIMVDMLGLEKLTNAFGLMILFQGLASFLGVPIAGLLRNISGSYDLSFYFAGFCICLSGVLLIPIHVIKRKQIKAAKKAEAAAKEEAKYSAVTSSMEPIVERTIQELKELEHENYLDPIPEVAKIDIKELELKESI